MAEKEASQVATDAGYTVVARRYRPKSFSELVGQENVSQALATAIRTGRIGHAYLFTGARGVGKTSTARIFAKALNAGTGPTADPDLDSDIARAIDAGEDMDVLEIDGASNRGIEEIRQLRANVNVRPSRSRFKIYIIDEVHMLTTQAFNALLKTLEEPPEHVKFIFCTTDPEKIPITVLSRCQRFDFPPVKKDAIQDRLRYICQQEGFQADDEALALIARRAAGSMRDSQSLLEQILSFSEGKITVESVQELLGTADDSSLWEMVERFIAHDAVSVLQAVEASVGQGVEPGQFAEQLLGYLRDLMTRSVGAPADLLRHVHSITPEQLSDQASRWGMQSLIAAMQILDESLVRMRHSMHGRTLLEMTLVQIAQLHRLEDLFSLSSSVPAVAANPDATPPVAPKPAPQATSPIEQKKNVEAVVTPATSTAVSAGAGAVAAASPPIAAVEVDVKPVTAATAQSSSMSSSLGSSSVPNSNHESHVESSRPTATSPAPVADGAGNAGVPGGRQTPAPAGVAVAEAPAHVAVAVAAPVATSSPPAVLAVDSKNAKEVWGATVDRLQGLLADFATLSVDAMWVDNEHLSVCFEKRSQHAIEHLQRTDRKSIVERELQNVLGRPTRVQFQTVPDRTVSPSEARPANDPNSLMQRNQRMRQVAEHPMVKALVDTLGGELVRIDPPSAPRSHLDRKG
ncbi:MAG: DNA polymerase III subunit gamma/tau [Planctomycetes bacterium]|nr:DNA polymerase III subunit gamma/tau [Planctomycetota bacterium]